MRTAVLTWLAVLFIPVASPCVARGEGGAVEQTSDEVLKQAAEFFKFQNAEKPEGEEARKAALIYFQARMARETEKIEETKSALLWTRIAARVVFFIAHVALLIGIVVACLEFRHARKLRAEAESLKKDRKEAKKAPEEHREVFEIEMNVEGVALKTSRHGIVLLLLSLAFYIAYLHFIYPLQEIGGSAK